MKILVASFASLLALAGCASETASTDPASSESDIVGGSGVAGDEGARLLAAFDAIGSTDHASGGALGIHAERLACATHTNPARGENDSLFRVPTTDCRFEAQGYASPFSVDDGPLPATLLFDALADVTFDPSVLDHESGGRVHVQLKSLTCLGSGLGGGYDPDTSPPFSVECTLTGTNGQTFTANEAKGRAIVRALIHANHGLQAGGGGRVQVDVAALHCVKTLNGSLDPSTPMQGIAETECTFQAFEQPATVIDPPQKAQALLVALQKAGVAVNHASGGVVGVTAEEIVCSAGNGRPASCSVK